MFFTLIFIVIVFINLVFILIPQKLGGGGIECDVMKGSSYTASFPPE